MAASGGWASGLCLVGAEAVFAPSDGPEVELGYYGRTFARLTDEVARRGAPTRFVAYQSPLPDQRRRHFLGIEVRDLAAIPDGLVGWHLTNGAWTVHEPGGRATPTPITWLWQAADAATGRLLGEFVAADTPVWLSGLAPTWPGRSADDAIEVVEPDEAWPARYDAMAAWLRDTLPPAVMGRLEHYGSTAVPGLPAKPVIDIALEVPSFAAAKSALLPLLGGDTWEYWWYGNHMTLVQRERPLGQRCCHLHAATADHRLWDGLLFRDWLRRHPDDARCYAALKRELAAALGSDRERYTLAKGEYVEAVTARERARVALAERPVADWPIRRKVALFITRGRQLLVFRHLDHPAAGLQVPAGTLHAGEPAVLGALREAHEETGLHRLRPVGLLGCLDVPEPADGEVFRWWCYHLTCPEPAPDRWLHWETGGGTQDPVRFEFAWHPLSAGIPPLMRGHQPAVEWLQEQMDATP